MPTLIRFIRRAPRGISSPWRIICAAFILGCCLGAPQAARAQVTCNPTFSGVAFGNIDVLPGTQIDSAGTLTTTCSGITGSTKVILCFGMDNGTYPLSGTNRQMGSGTNRLAFNIYQDSGRSVVWDSTSSGKVAQVFSTSVTSVTSNMYGRVVGSQQSVPPGSIRRV
jgi:spore coat protein U-like protein